MNAQAKTYTVHFPTDARPGVLAIGGIKRGGSAQADAAEAVRLVDAKGLRFASGADEKAARAEVAAATEEARVADAVPSPAPSAQDTLSEEH